MNPSSPTVADAVSRIREAFSDVTRGRGCTLEEADLHDSCTDDPSRFEAARERAVDVHWWQIPSDELGRWGDSIHFLDQAGYLYYLPALMTWSLELRREQFYRGCSPAVVWSLGRVSRSGKRFTPCRFLDAMTVEQRSAVASFLRVAAAHFECEDARALVSFWESASAA